MLTHATKRWALKQHVAHNALAHLLPEQILGLADTLVAHWRQMVQPHSFRCSLARGARGAQFLSPAAANLEKVLWKYIFWSNLAKTTLWSTLSAMSIVGEPSILLLRHIQTSPLTLHVLNSSAAKKVLFSYSTRKCCFCCHATLSQSGSDLKQLTLVYYRKD